MLFVKLNLIGKYFLINIMPEYFITDRTLDITLTWPQKYSEHKDLFKRALDIDIDYYVGIKQSGQLWEPGQKHLDSG